MKDKSKLTLLGVVLRVLYDLYRKNTINSENKSYFEFLETCGKEIRYSLEEDPDFKNIYQGSDIVKAFEELNNVLKKVLFDDKKSLENKH